MKQFSSAYKVLDKFILRTPCLPYSTILSIYKSKTPYKDLENILQKDNVNKTIYLASPEFHQRLTEILSRNGELKNNPKIYHTCLKYLSRMSTRSTPFGTFADVSIGTFGNETKIIKSNKSFTKTRLDYSLLHKIADKAIQNIKLDSEILFYPNNTLYKLGHDYRYVEIQWVNNKKDHVLQRIPINDPIQRVVKESKKGVGLKQLINMLVDLGYSESESKDYIDDLVKSQILISNLNPSLIGEHYQEILEKSLSKVNELYSKKFTKALSYLEKIDDENNILTLSEEINKSFKSLDLSDFVKETFHVNSFNNQKKCTLNKKVKISLSRALNVLSVFTTYENENLKRFSQDFTQRFGARTIELTKALDYDTGIGYPKRLNRASHPYINDLSLDNSINTGYKPILTSQEINLISKINSAKSNVIELSDADLNSMKSNNLPLNNTFSGIAEIHKENGLEKISIQDIGGSTANQLIARFNDNEEIFALSKYISKLDINLNPSIELADINYLPENKTGNVLFRKHIYDKKINITSGINNSSDCIPLTDIHIKVINSQPLLINKKSGKQIIPILSNAHNYNLVKNPTYRLLCDLQYTSNLPSIGFKWGNIELLFNRFPRVEYKNVIIAKAQWMYKPKEVGLDRYHSLSDNEIVTLITEWRLSEQIPRFVQLQTFDNFLLIDFESKTGIKLFLKEAVKEKRFKLIETPWIENSIVFNENDNEFNGEFLFLFKKTTK